MAQQDHDLAERAEVAAMLDALRRIADALRAQFPEARVDFDEVQRNIAFLEGLATSGDALGVVRLKVAQGLSRLRDVLNLNDAQVSSMQVIQTVAAEMCWPLVVARDLPDGWYRVLTRIASSELATLVSTIRAVRLNRDPERVKMELTASLANPKYAPGVWNLLQDMQDAQGGWPALSSVLTMRDAHPPRRPSDLRTLLIVVATSMVTVGTKAAFEGIIGNRADALFQQFIEALRQLVEPRVAQGQPPAPPPRAPAAQPLLIALPKLGFRLELVRVPAGEFLMGSDKAKDKVAYDEELPQHWVYLDEYLIGKYPVTVAQFAAFVKATGYKTTAEREGSASVYMGGIWDEVEGANWQRPHGPKSDVMQKQDHPVTCVSWDDAVAFCKWLSEASGRHVRLPTEAQWEKAARWDERRRHARIWPWGNDAPTARHCNFDMNVTDTTPVGRYSPLGDSPYGCADMAGNVWEWCADWYDGEEYERRAGKEVRNPTGPSQGAARVLRGGAFLNSTDLVRCAYRSPGSATLVFECVRSPSASDLCSSVLCNFGHGKNDFLEK